MGKEIRGIARWPRMARDASMSEPRERPILFSSPMVRAILSGAKVQTRRIVKPQPVRDHEYLGGWAIKTKRSDTSVASINQGIYPEACPYGKVGDRLWVRETCKRGKLPHILTGEPTKNEIAVYAADDEPCTEELGFDLVPWWKGPVCASIHLPRWASRITLEITAVRIEQLNCITDSDARAEGIHCFKLPNGNVYGYDPKGTPGKMVMDSATDAYAALWEKINGAGSWKINPFVWVVSFKRIDATPNPR